MPTNLYGPNDNFEEDNGHVIPALVSRFRKAQTQGDDEVSVWGSGTPLREFLHSDDLARALVLLMQTHLSPDTPHSCLFNIGSGEEVTISELAHVIAKAVGFEGKIRFDRAKPDGTPRKLLDSSFLRELGWSPAVRLRDGIDLLLGDRRIEELSTVPVQ